MVAVPAGFSDDGGAGLLNPAGPKGGSSRGVARWSNLTSLAGAEVGSGMPAMPDMAAEALLAGVGAGDSWPRTAGPRGSCLNPRLPQAGL